ncbi:TIR domain-containing protein [Enterococcus sp. DIV0840c]|uniref:TIR domain-containing protein n=1 Tax=Enterococcus sp. DIV0840c TaxID=2774772 RepID=UPI003D26870E
MSVNTYQQKEKSLLNEIARLEKYLANEQKNIATSEKKIASNQSSIARSKSASTIRTKQRTIETETRKLVQSKKKIADYSSKLARKKKELGDNQIKLTKATQAENNKFQKELQNSYEEQLETMRQLQQEEIKGIHSDVLNDPSLSNKEYDIFISYASEDSNYVDKLEAAFNDAGFSIWRDKTNIGWGNSIRQSIDNGLVKSKFGLVVISSDYIQKYWTGYELDGILSKESSTGRQMILPLWHNVTKDEVDAKSPTLSNRLALDTRLNTISDIVAAFKSLIE